MARQTRFHWSDRPMVLGVKERCLLPERSLSTENNHFTAGNLKEIGKRFRRIRDDRATFRRPWVAAGAELKSHDGIHIRQIAIFCCSETRRIPKNERLRVDVIPRKLPAPFGVGQLNFDYLSKPRHEYILDVSRDGLNEVIDQFVFLLSTRCGSWIAIVSVAQVASIEGEIDIF